MKNICLFAIAIILLPVIYFSSCAKVEDDNVAQPTISNIRFNESDTIMYYDKSGIRRRLLFNDSTETGQRQTDILVPGKWLYISADMHAEGKLSTFIVRGELRYKSIRGYDDSIFEIKRLGQGVFSNKQDSSVYRNRLVQIPDTIVDNNRSLLIDNRWERRADTLYLYAQEPYNLYTVLMDRFGNRSDSAKDARSVKFMRRKELVEAMGK